MAESVRFKLTEEDIARFQEDGAIVLRNVFSQDWIEKLKKGIADNQSNPSKYSENLRAPEGPGYYFNDYCNWRKIGEFKDFIHNTGVAELAGKLMRSKYSVFYHEHVLTKDASTYKATPWHQDQPYYPIDGAKNCSLWIPVDSVCPESTIQFVQGSHRWGKWFHPKKFESENKYIVEDNTRTRHVFEDIPAINEQDFEILKWACEPGDCVVFHMLTVHGAPANLMTTSRRVVSLRWLGDDAVLAERPWQVSPPERGGLSPGDSVICDTFPVLWNEPDLVK